MRFHLVNIRLHTILLFLILASAPLVGVAQKKKGKRKTQNTGIMNLRNFDRQKIHFGFSLGYNNAAYDYENSLLNDTLAVLEVNPDPGFNIGLISVLHLSENVKLKFMPDISFQSRTAEYTYYSPVVEDFLPTELKPVESTFLNFPLLFKLRTNRINNFAAAVLVGGKYGLDIASQENVVDETVLKTRSKDLAAEAGVGLDFFLQYFKLGLELKYAHGFNDMLVQDNIEYSIPFDYFQSRVWTFTVTFEGSW